MTSRPLALLFTVALLAVGCANDSPAPDQASTPAAVTPTTTGLLPPGVPTEGARPPADHLPPPAEPGQAPVPNGIPPGRIVPVGDAPEGVVVDALTRTVAVLKRNPNELVLLNADTGEITGHTPLPGSGRHLQLAKPAAPSWCPSRAPMP